MESLGQSMGLEPQVKFRVPTGLLRRGKSQFVKLIAFERAKTETNEINELLSKYRKHRNFVFRENDC